MLSFIALFSAIAFCDSSFLESKIHESNTTAKMRQHCLVLDAVIMAKFICGNENDLVKLCNLAGGTHFSLLNFRQSQAYCSFVICQVGKAKKMELADSLITNNKILLERPDLKGQHHSIRSDKKYADILDINNDAIIGLEVYKVELAEASLAKDSGKISDISRRLLDLATTIEGKNRQAYITALSNYVYYRCINNIDCFHISIEKMQQLIQEAGLYFSVNSSSYLRIAISNALLLSLNGSEQQRSLCIEVTEKIRSDCNIANLANNEQYDMYKRSSFALIAMYKQSGNNAKATAVKQELNDVLERIKAR
ncbi:MAG TPA: hypothetical protein PKA06_07410 [Gemmatales bacterium]|nr:hypothetical protein [Gemmatales bacterium]